MAKTQREGTTEYVALPKGSIDTLGNDEPVSDEELAFDEFVSGMAAERMGEIRVGKIKVAKDGTPIANTKSAHCFSAPIDQFTYSALLEHIRARHGAGLYRVVGVEAGKRGLIFNRLLEIAEELNPPAAQESALQSPANMLESVGKIMAESQARTEGLIARLTESKPAAVDPMEQLTKMATLFATIMGAVPKPVPTAGDDFLGQLEKLAKIKDLLGGLGGGGGGDSDKESNFFDVVKAGLTSFGPALATLAVRGAQQGAPAALPAPQPLQPPIGTDPRTFYQPQGPMQSQQPAAPAADENMKKQVDILVQNAKMGTDPMQLAGVILDMTPDEKLDDLEAMISAPNMIDNLATLNPEVTNYRPFFEKLRDSLKTLLKEIPADTLPANTPAGGSGAPTS